MWGTDGVRVFTVDDGWGWIFTAVEHWNAECVGWHVCKRGDRFAALQPISMGQTGLVDRGRRGLGGWPCGWTRLPVSSPLHRNQIKFWGIQAPTPVAEPQTSGVAEHFNRTRRNRFHGRIYATSQSCGTPCDFVELYSPVDRRFPAPELSLSSPAWHAKISRRKAVFRTRRRETESVYREPIAVRSIS